MPSRNSSEWNKKITNFISKPNSSTQGNSLKRPISPYSTMLNEREPKRTNLESNPNSLTMSNKETPHNNPELDSIEENTTIKQALGPLINEFRLL